MDNGSMRRAFIAAVIVAAAIFTPVADAHITISPTRAAPGSDQILTFTVPNERVHGAITGVLIGNGRLKVEQIEQKPGWRVIYTNGNIVAWEGGRIGPGRLERFAFTATMPTRPRTIRFDAWERFGKTLEAYHPQLSVAPELATATRDRSARSLAKWALFVALAAAALAVGAWVVALGGWLKRG